MINRVGLLNFWYYQNQIFQLADGKMILRGTNGSGKSLTMQSLFPVLFDGDTSAYRLDSFGSRDRKMEDYLLGEKGVSDRDEGTGYLFLEVKREQREEYLTIGIGMHAHRGGRLNKWFFAIENNQRIGINFELFEELIKGELTPFTKKKLKNRLENKGRIFDTRREYKAFVNQRIFGFETLEQFEELIALLINLRSPKLSKEFRPSVIYGILRDSLPKLKEDELLTLSKTIEQLDGHRERLEDLNNELQELEKFAKVYQNWQEELVGQISAKWLSFVKDKQRLEKETKKEQKEQHQWQEDLIQKQAQFTEEDTQLKALAQVIQELNQHDGMNLVQRGQELQEQLENTQKDKNKNEKSLERRRQQLQGQKERFEKQTLEKETYLKDMLEALEDNEQYLEYLHLENLDDAYATKMKTSITSAEFTYWKTQIQQKQQHFQEVIEWLRRLNQKEQQLTELEQEVGNLQQKLDELQRDHRQWQQTRQDEVEKWKQAIDEWQVRSPFRLSEKNYAELWHRMDQLLEEELREDVVIAPLTNSYQEALTANQRETIPLTEQKANDQREKDQKLLEIKEWQNQKIPEIEQRFSRKENRQKLSESTQFTNFYQSVDFRPEIAQENRDRLEGALFASGILDSLISKEGLVVADDIQILPQPKFFTTTLADFLKVQIEVDTDLQPIVADVLQSVVVNELDPELPAVFYDGSYQIANLKGKMPIDYQASYIGAASQERYRKKMITQLQADITILDNQIETYQQAIVNKESLRKQITLAYEQRPSGNEIYEAIREMQKVDTQYQTRSEEWQKKQEQASVLAADLKTAKIALRRMTQQDGLSLLQETYQDAHLYAKYYEENLADAYRNYQSVQNKKGLIENVEQTIAIYEEDEKDLLATINDLVVKEQQEQRSVKENLKQQQLVDVEGLQAQLRESLAEQKVRTQRKERANEAINTLKTKIAVNENNLKRVLQELKQVAYFESHWQQLFRQEIQHFEVPEQKLKQLAQKQQKETNIKKLKERESAVQVKFNYLADQLQSYDPKLLNAFDIELSEEEEQRLGEFASYNNYKQPSFIAEGQQQTLFDLLERLTQQKLTLQDLLKKDDEQLFKTIILESVGNILRVRIQQAMQWVEQMNELLQSQKNSSGLSLSIQWKGIPSASEQDLGTARLVALLQKPTSLLSEADREAISQHFQEKVRYAQEQVQENPEDRSTLFQAIAKVLDYRDWFEFELKYERANEGYRPQILTDRRFNQFSGGEKAISMYLPLFAAMYSRYLDAADFCPKMITLDEAFAGIDDLNIAELFKFCEQLGFNYVMNSQALFGDYPKSQI